MVDGTFKQIFEQNRNFQFLSVFEENCNLYLSIASARNSGIVSQISHSIGKILKLYKLLDDTNYNNESHLKKIKFHLEFNLNRLHITKVLNSAVLSYRKLIFYNKTFDNYEEIYMDIVEHLQYPNNFLDMMEFYKSCKKEYLMVKCEEIISTYSKSVLKILQSIQNLVDVNNSKET